MYYYAIVFVCEYLLAPIIYLLQAIDFWLLWFGGVFTIRFVGSPPLLLILSGQAKYFFVPFKGTSNQPPPHPHPPPPKKKEEEKRKKKRKKAKTKTKRKRY